MTIRAGDLRHRVTIRRKTLAPKPGGGLAETWSDVATVWAEVVGLNGREAVIAQALQGISAYRVTIRHRADVSADCQLRFGSVDLNIKSIADPDGRREQLQIFADTEGVER